MFVMFLFSLLFSLLLSFSFSVSFPHSLSLMSSSPSPSRLVLSHLVSSHLVSFSFPFQIGSLSFRSVPFRFVWRKSSNRWLLAPPDVSANWRLSVS